MNFGSAWHGGGRLCGEYDRGCGSDRGNESGKVVGGRGIGKLGGGMLKLFRLIDGGGKGSDSGDDGGGYCGGRCGHCDSCGRGKHKHEGENRKGFE